MQRPLPRSGFTLLEMTIVIAFIGLLIGGLIGGKSMIRQSQVQSVITDFTNYKNAYNQFKQKYEGVPGDLADATDFWGSAGGTGKDVACYDVYKTGQATCNGDGNGVVTGVVLGTHQTYAERFLFWQHLANAGLITGSYLGRTDDVNGINLAPDYSLSLSRNIPSSRIDASFWDVWSYTDVTIETWALTNTKMNSNFLYLGSVSASGVLSTKEMLAIDSKYDDGKPGFGQISTNRDACATTTDAATAEYTVTDSEARCALRIYF